MSFEIQNNILSKYINDNDEIDILIPYGIREIGNFCFSYADNIRSIHIPDSVKKIGKFAIDGCKNLKNINIPDSVVIIEDYAFSGCESLTFIYIPESVKFIGNNIFSGCLNLQKIDISKDNPNYTIKDNVLFSKDISNLLSYTVSKPEKYYTVPNTVTRIGGEAFSDSSLIGINLPESLRTIEHLAFSGCRSLEYIKIPENIVSLSSMTFLACENLRRIDMPLSLKTINDYCFDGCKALEYVKMPFSINIMENSFHRCSSIKHLTLFDDKYIFTIDVQKNIRYSDMKKILEFFQNGFKEETFNSIRRSDCKIQIALFVLHRFKSDFCYKYIKKNIKKSVKYLR